MGNFQVYAGNPVRYLVAISINTVRKNKMIKTCFVSIAIALLVTFRARFSPET